MVLHIFIPACAPLAQAMSPILLASLSRLQWICVQCRRTILKSTTRATGLSLQRAYHPCTVLLQPSHRISEKRLQARAQEAQQRQPSADEEKPWKRTVIPLPLPTAEERRKNIAQQVVLDQPISPSIAKGRRKTQTRGEAYQEAYQEAQDEAQDEAQWGFREQPFERATTAEKQEQNVIQKGPKQAFSLPPALQRAFQRYSREQPSERATTVEERQNVAIQALRKAFPLSTVEDQAQREIQQNLREQPSERAIMAEERQQQVAQQTIQQALSPPIAEVWQQDRLNRQKQTPQRTSLDSPAFADDPASLVSKLLNNATSKSLYSHGKPDTLSTLGAPKKWATNPVIRPVVREAIQKAYPHVEDLTPIQAKLFVALSKRTHLSLADIPGTGKSFALACWLLNVDRSIRTGKGDVEPTTTALVLVPNPDLAMQYESWITNILSNSSSEVIKKNLPSFVQALYRTGTVEGDDQQKCRLKEYPNPHILVATPQRVLDIMEEKLVDPHHLLDLEHLKLVVVDEADSLFDLGILFHKENKVKSTLEKKQHMLPAEQLLDFIFENRNAKLIGPRQAKGELNYMQIVLASSSDSAKQMRRFIEQVKRSWLSPYGTPWSGGALGQGISMGFAPHYTPVKEGDLVSHIIASLQRVETTSGEVLRKVHSSIKHYLIAYDMETGILRDAPLDRMLINKMLKKFLRVSTKLKLVGGRAPQRAKLQEIQAQLGKEALSVPGLDIQEKKVIGDHGYPEELAVPILEKLLEYDNWPRHVIVGLGLQTSKQRFQQSCAEVGIKAEILSYQAWNSQGGKVSKLGRSDEHIADAGGDLESMLVEGKQNTSVWITDPVSCPGLDSPGITHAYIFHRIESTKDYVAYCGRVSRHPFADTGAGAVDPIKAGSVALLSSDENAPGKIKSRYPTPGKVVSIILEENITPEEMRSERETEKSWLALEAAAAAGKEGAGRGPTSPHQGSGYRSGKGEKVVRVISGAGNRWQGVEIGLPVLQRGSIWEQDAYLAEGIKREKIGCVVEKFFGEDQRFQERRVLDWDNLDDDELEEKMAEMEEAETRRIEEGRTVEKRTEGRMKEVAVGERTVGESTEGGSTEEQRIEVERTEVKRTKQERIDRERIVERIVEGTEIERTEPMAADNSFGWGVGGPIGSAPKSESVRPERETFVSTARKHEEKILEADRPKGEGIELKEKCPDLSEKQPIGNIHASPSLATPAVAQNMETPSPNYVDQKVAEPLAKPSNDDVQPHAQKVTLNTAEELQSKPVLELALSPELAPSALILLPVSHRQ